MEAAFFDLDKTIISRSSSLALSRPLYRAGMVSRGQLLRGAYAQLVYLLVGADEDKMERLKEGMAPSRSWCRSPAPRAKRAWHGGRRSSSLRAVRRRGSPARPDPAGD